MALPGCAAVALFTRLPCGSAQAQPGRVMLAGPLVGALVAVLSAVPGAALLLTGTAGAPWLAALAAVTASAYLTRGLHLDGLADFADGLGSARSRAEALAIMQRSDIGPFGVITLVLVIAAQIGLLGALTDAGGAAALVAALLIAESCGRASAMWSCRRGVPAAPGSRLGAWVAGTVPAVGALVVTTVLVGAAGLLSLLLGGPAWTGPFAVVLAWCVGLLVERTARRRFDGITGDVLGAIVQAASTAALLGLVVLW